MTITGRTGLTTGTTVVASGSSYYVPASGSTLATSAPGTPEWAAAAGDLLIVTLLSDGNTVAKDFTSPALADNIGTNGGLNPWINFVPVYNYSLGGVAGSATAWYKIAVGGEKVFTPTFTQSSALRNSLTVDCLAGWIGKPTLDPGWSDTIYTVTNPTTTASVMFAYGVSLNNTTYVPNEVVYTWAGVGNTATGWSVAATGIPGTPALLAQGSYSASSLQDTTGGFTAAFLSTGFTGISWTSGAQAFTGFSASFYDAGTIIGPCTMTATSSAIGTTIGVGGLSATAVAAFTAVGAVSLPTSALADTMGGTSLLSGTISAPALLGGPLPKWQKSGIRGQGLRGDLLRGGASGALTAVSPALVVVSSAAGNVSVKAPLTGSLGGSSGLTATVSSTAGLVGPLGGAGTLVGTPSAIAGLPAATAGSSAAFSAAATVIVPLTASVHAQSGLTGSLGGKAALPTGSSFSSSSITGSPNTALFLTGGVVSSAGFTGYLGQEVWVDRTFTVPARTETFVAAPA